MAEDRLTVEQRTQMVKSFARQLGFTDVGIAVAEPLEQEMMRYRWWLQHQYHGVMAYLEKRLEKRYDPRNVLPGARSVVVVAYNYYTPYQHRLKPGEGKISRYGWGKDYHKIVKKKLHRLARFIEAQIPGEQTRVYVDTGPVMEKQWAVRAGIGWQGKHSNVISRKFGSWFFIGVVLTTAELQPDSPIADFCGRCTACLDACPTGAIVQPYVVDARRCISYWTIEVKPEQEIPSTIADRLDGWLFGCDVCQDVCPWNRFQQPTHDPRFAPVEQPTLALDDVLTMDEEEFHRRFQGTPLKRAKLAGLQRTAKALQRWWKKVKAVAKEGFDHKQKPTPSVNL